MLSDVLSEPRLSCPIYSTAREALAEPCDVFFEFTKPEAAKANVLAALEAGAHAVIGTSGLTDGDYAEIATAADTSRRGVLAVGNFALTVVLLQKFARSLPGSFPSGRSSTMPAMQSGMRPVERCANWHFGCRKSGPPH